MLLVDGLSAHAEFRRDLLPGPAPDAGVAHLDRFELFEQPAQRADRPQPDPGVLVARRRGEFGCLRHGVNSG
ncbi:hypothetical protein BN6_81570 [Saccharothrix espanaensis DSM 44229]|uniref:Uncharacterized protein n=1 Tax=Saccharothrix espanaensis (strain ATCC 51144 / DSM 44229 / JCM 9112 / NBRC 15066 / NRRL 15764) TaxID=1179773 RepID=K0KF14_SACES|nr:hypothetical protein BN6_81570 [Saccharothrix espanaensis DSM 44229]